MFCGIDSPITAWTPAHEYREMADVLQCRTQPVRDNGTNGSGVE